MSAGKGTPGTGGCKAAGGFAYHDPMPEPPIQLPLAFDLVATFVSALAGALVAVRRHYDFVGVFALAFVTGLGGALIRDGIFLQGSPPLAVRDSRYLLAV